MNMFNFTGNLGRDAQVRFTQTGKAVTSFAVAVQSGYGDRERTTWIDCTLWGRGAEPMKVSDYLVKGQKVAVSAEIWMDTYDTTEGPKSKIAARVIDVTLVGEKKGEVAHPIEQPAQAVPEVKPGDFEDTDIPF